jgi:hypothetical protein
MPNWCENKMIVIGSLDNLSKLYQDLNNLSLKDSEGFLEKYIPTPAELMNKEASFFDQNQEDAQKMKEKYGAADWYWWRVNNWGTKWDLGDVYGINLNGGLEDNKYTLCCHFESAWAPPEEGIRKLSEIFKDTYFFIEFSEPGMGFEGYYSCMNGENVGSVTTDSYTKLDQVENDAEYYYNVAIEMVGSNKESE